MLEEGWGQWPSLQSCVLPISPVWSPRVTLGPEHALNDLAGPGHIDCLLFHVFISRWEGGLHYFGGDGVGETSKEEVGAFIVPCGVVHKME